jgi:hypothetical protein
LSKILQNKPQSAEQRLTQAIDLLEMADFNLKDLQPKPISSGFLARHDFDLAVMFSLLLFFFVQTLFLLYRIVCFIWQRQNIACDVRYKKIE